jgi:hypothetical protein
MEHFDLTETARLRKLYGDRVARPAGGASAACVDPEAILALVRQEGSEAERLATLEHVMSCAECHREYEWLSAVNEAAEETAGSAAGRRPTVWWRSTPVAAAASLLIVAGTALVLQARYRSGSEEPRGGDREIALAAPAAGTVAGPLTFVWHPLPGVGRYVLEVQRADGAIALADTTADTLVTVDPSRLGADSLYRWWVREAAEGTEPRSSAFRDLRLRR